MSWTDYPWLDTSGGGTPILATVLKSEFARVASYYDTATFNPQTGGYTLALADRGKMVEVNSAAGVNLTVPPASAVAFPVGTIIEVLQYGAGQVVFLAGVGVTIRSFAGRAMTAGQYARARLIKHAANEWILTGDLVASTSSSFGFSMPGIESTTRYIGGPATALDYAAGLGAGWIRFDVPWQSTEGPVGVYTWTTFDPIIDMITARGMKPLIILDYNNTLYAASTTTGIAAGATANRNAYVAWATAAVNHFKTRGVTAYEIWNEPNGGFWQPTPSAADYTTLLQAVYPAMKAADPTCTVLGGSVAALFSSPTMFEFVTSMYAAGAQGYFDALSVHPYVSPNLPGDGIFSGWTKMIDVQALMVANGDSAKKVWGSEAGAPTGGTDGSGEIVSEQRQADQIETGMSLWKTYPWAGVLLYHTLRDPIDLGTASHEAFFGVLRTDFSEKPGAVVFRAETQGDPLTASDGVFPQTSVLDSGVGANATPPSASWTQAVGGGGTQGLKRLTNRIVAVNNATDQNAYWSATQFAADQEAFLTVAVKPADGFFFNLFVRIQQPGGATVDLYELDVKAVAGVDTWQLYRVINNAAVKLTGAIPMEFAAGDQLGLRIRGSILRAYKNGTQVVAVRESSITGAGYIGMSMDQSVPAVTGFGGGALP